MNELILYLIYKYCQQINTTSSVQHKTNITNLQLNLKIKKIARYYS